ncbi:hypothetical protein NPIL_679841 [Nephila pilipes]|uniref:Uncharacterized protein n=1 Tax=Nephila pilipes TaxID=299642 RepID=A0A8X6PZG6_NEPPI|nr:hypothetical protein NPIL_679841 [Nephila pilipes]
MDLFSDFDPGIPPDQARVVSDSQENLHSKRDSDVPPCQFEEESSPYSVGSNSWVKIEEFGIFRRKNPSREKRDRTPSSKIQTSSGEEERTQITEFGRESEPCFLKI